MHRASLPLLLGLIASLRPADTADDCKKAIVEVSVSPLVDDSKVGELELSWVVEGVEDGDWVGLHLDEVKAAPVFWSLVLVPAGWVRTHLSEKRHFREPDYRSLCSGYWAAYWRHNSTRPLASSCLRTNPRWMEESWEAIQGLRLKDTFLPGTHDSAAFQITFSPTKLSRFEKYTFAQDETIMEQLIHGARYLDLRVGYYDGIWWANHGIAKVHPLEHVLHDIKTFVNSTQEIIVLDFHNFPVGFKEKRIHDKLVNYLEMELGPLVASPHLSWQATLRDIWMSGRRIILAYNDRDTVSKYQNTLWTPVSQRWANVRHISKLKSYFSDIFKSNSKPNYAWAAMVELTPNAWSVITDEHGGLRQMADSVNKEVTNWFRGSWGSRCNAVAVDFIRSTGIVQAAIRWNKRKGKGITCKFN